MSTEKRDDIVRVALELIVEHGFHGTSMAMIADQAKVGAGTIYRYFKSKDVLINDLFLEMTEKISTNVMEESAEDYPIQDRLLHLGVLFMKYMIANPICFRYLEQFFHSPYGVKLRRDKVLGLKNDYNIFDQLFLDGIDQGVVKDLPVVVLCALWFGPMMAMLRDHISDIFVLEDLLIHQIAEACWDGIRR